MSMPNLTHTDGTWLWIKLPRELTQTMLSTMRLRDMDALGATNKWFNSVVSDYQKRVRSISRLLGRFFSLKHIGEFQELQGSTGLLISGSTALQFFSCSAYDTDLDTYCIYSRCLEVGRWLLSIGYEFLPSANQSAQFTDNHTNFLKHHQNSDHPILTDCYGHHIAQVWNFGRAGLKIQLIGSVHAPIEVILSFHSTCVMNFITHAAAYSLFPHMTFTECNSLAIETSYPVTETQDLAFQKYVNRGYTIISTINPDSSTDPLSAMTFLLPRYVGDKHCWKIPIKFYGKVSARDFIEINSWDIFYKRTSNVFKAHRFPIIQPGNQAYITATSERGHLRTGIAGAKRIITQKIIDDENAVLLLLQDVYRSRRGDRFICARGWTTTKRVKHFMDANNLPLTTPTIHDLLGFFATINNRRNAVAFVNATQSQTDNRRTVLTVEVDKTRLDEGEWEALSDWGKSFMEDRIDVVWRKMITRQLQV